MAADFEPLYASYCSAFATARTGGTVSVQVGAYADASQVVAAAIGAEEGRRNNDLSTLETFKDRFARQVGKDWKHD